MSIITPELLQKLASFDTPTICNIVELFDVRPRNTGYMDWRIRCNFPELPPMVGFAATVSFRSDAPPAGGDAYGTLDAQVATFAALPGPAIPVFADLDDPPVAATFGEVMCSTYQGFGAAGLITSGAGRDLDQVRAIKFPVFTSGTICAHGYCHILHIGLPVRVGGLTVRNGDLLHGDSNGVTNVPVNLVEAICEIGDEFVASERVVLDYVRGSGPKTAAGLGERRKEFSALVAQLTKKARAMIGK